MLQTNADVTLCDYVRFQGEKLFPFTQPNVAAGFYNKAQIREIIYPHLVMDGIEYPITISNWALLIRREVIVKIACHIVRISVSVRMHRLALRCCIARTALPT